jgi:UTP:GlnB (protein PII) uridylyltransferase
MPAGDGLKAQLINRGFPGDVVDELVDGIVGLWLLHEPPHVLAEDLALCSPRPPPGELRVRVRPLGSPDRQRITLVGTDCPGMLAATAGVLAASGLSVREAVATTWPHCHMALQALTVEDPACRASSQQRWHQIGEQITDVLSGAPPPPVLWRPRGPVHVRAERMDLEHTLLTVEARDRVGLLWAIASHLRDVGLSIVAAAVADSRGRAVDRFLADGFPDTDELTRSLDRRRRGT